MARIKVTASQLNVRSGPGASFRVVGRLDRGAEVELLEEHDQWKWVAPPGGWVSGQYVEPLPELEPTPGAAVAPRGLDEIKAMFGAPGNAMASAGRAKLPMPLPLGWEPATRITRFPCHAKLAERFTRVFQSIHDQGLGRHLRTFDGCYNDRPTKVGGKKSTHAWGIAVDLNAATNRQGGPGDMHPGIVQAFKDEGFVWGGDFSGRSRDDMHFQYASQY